MTFKDSDSLLFKEPRNDCQDAVVINFETNISRRLNSNPLKKFNPLPLTIVISPIKETNIQMTLLEEDIQQLRIRKIKGTNRLLKYFFYITSSI